MLHLSFLLSDVFGSVFISGYCFSQFCVRFCVSVRSCFSNFCVLFDVSGHWFSVFCVWTVALWKCRSSQYCAASQARLSCPPCLVILFTVLHSRVRIFFKIKVIIALVVCSAWERCQCMVKVHPIQSQSIFSADCIYWIPVQTGSSCKVRNFDLKLLLKKLRIQFNYIFLLWPVACLPLSGNWIEAEREINPSVSVKPAHARALQ